MKPQFVKDGAKHNGYNVFIDGKFIGEVWKHIPGVWYWKGRNKAGVYANGTRDNDTRTEATAKLIDWVLS